ncbi:MAG: response regulator [Patescibacteria group bacterium]
MSDDTKKAQETSSIPISSMLKRNETKLLVVEDDRFLRELLVGKLKREGFSVVEAFNGEEALTQIRAEHPHLILLDLVLPGTDGFGVLATMKEKPELKTPTIVLSNLGSREDIDKAMDYGAKEFMVKAHHTPQEIVERVKKVLDEHYLHQ